MVKKKRGVKKKEGLKLEINFTNRWLYTLILVFAFVIAGVFVYAQTPDVFGHHYDDLDLGPITIDSDTNEINVAENAVINGLIVGSGIIGDGLVGNSIRRNDDAILWFGSDNVGIDSKGDIRFRKKSDLGDILRLYPSNKSAKFFGDVCIGDVCKSDWPSGGESLWTQSGSDIYYDGGNVAVGTIPLFLMKNYLLEVT